MRRSPGLGAPLANQMQPWCGRKGKCSEARAGGKKEVEGIDGTQRSLLALRVLRACQSG